MTKAPSSPSLQLFGEEPSAISCVQTGVGTTPWTAFRRFKENTATQKTFTIAVIKHRARGDKDSNAVLEHLHGKR